MATDRSQIIEELVAIKKLLNLNLANTGFTQSQISSELDIDHSSVSRMFPKGALSAIKARGNKSD